MSNKRQNKIFIYSLIIFIIFIYISTFFIHSIVDKGRGTPEIISPGDNTGDNTDDIGNDNNNNSNNGNNNTGEDNSNGGSGNNQVVDIKDRIKVFQNGEKEWSELKELNIFTNSFFDEAIIAPGVNGKYNFTVENVGDVNCLYNIDYTEENAYDVNMVYKLKKNGAYIIGDDNNWVKYDSLGVTNVNLKAHTNDIYTIEWKWEDSSNDTEIGRTEGAKYKLFINVYAQEKEGM